MTMTHDQLHTHGPDELAMLRAECAKWHKAYDRVWEERMRFADRAIELEKENAALKEESRWRKFHDEKPEWGKEVLVLADDGDIRRVRFSCDYKWISWGNMKTCESSCITHWMPEPHKPEVE